MKQTWYGDKRATEMLSEEQLKKRVNGMVKRQILRRCSSKAHVRERTGSNIYKISNNGLKGRRGNAIQSKLYSKKPE